MGAVVYLNFKTGIRTVPDKPQNNFGEVSNRIKNGMLGYDETIDLKFYDQIVARYSINPPRGGVVFKAPISTTSKTIYIDTYGRGCTHNSSGNPFRAALTKQGLWNRPMPFPSDLSTIYRYLKTDKTKRMVQVGLKSDPFMWLDQRYKLTQELLRMLNYFDRPYNLFTSSDLVAHTDYLKLLDPKLCTVLFRIPQDCTESELRELEPGSPSLKRRIKAKNLLLQSGFSVKIKTKLKWSIPKNLTDEGSL